MKSRKNESGQAVVLTTVALIVLLGMAAFVLDVGNWFRTDRRLQGTADAAALAGAHQLPDDPAGAKATALDYANRNGGDVQAADITVYRTFAANDTIRVTAAKNEAGFFSKVFGMDGADIEAGAVARVGTPYSVQNAAPMVVSCAHDLIQNCNDNGNIPTFDTPTTLEFNKFGAPGAFGMLNFSKTTGTPGTDEEAEWIEDGYEASLPISPECGCNYRSDPGAKFASKEIRAALEERLAPGADPLLFPVFELSKSLTEGGGQVASYYIIGWIAFKITSYEIHGNEAILHGYFVEYLAHGILTSTGSGTPAYGVKSIQLIE
jgi:Flp pilus assembly protein TadG